METHFNNTHLEHTIGNMSYIPPHLRNKQKTNETTTHFKNDRREPRRVYERPKPEIHIPEKTEENFPVLVSSSVPLRAPTTARKFNELASDWKIEDEIRKEQEQLDKGSINKNSVFVLPKFRNVQRFSEPEDMYLSDTEVEFKDADNDEWTTVNNKKPRKPRSERRPIETDDMDQQSEEEDTVWEATEEQESCWDQN
jgi:hypothetical protein